MPIPRFLGGLSVHWPLGSPAKLVALLLVAGAALSAKPAAAQVFKVTASGTLDSVDNTAGLYDSSVAVGTPFTFSFLFNYSTPPLPNSPGQYNQFGVGSGGSASFGNYTFTPAADTYSLVVVQNNFHSLNLDILLLYTGDETTTGFTKPVTGANVYINIGNANGGLLSSEALPSLSTYNVANTSYTIFDAAVVDSHGVSSEAQGTITSLSAELVNPVPEASTTVSFGLLLALGGGAWVVRRRRAAG